MLTYIQSTVGSLEENIFGRDRVLLVVFLKGRCFPAACRATLAMFMVYSRRLSQQPPGLGLVRLGLAVSVLVFWVCTLVLWGFWACFGRVGFCVA